MEEALTLVIDNNSELLSRVKQIVAETPEDELEAALQNWVQSLIDNCDFETGSGFYATESCSAIAEAALAMAQSWANHANWDKIAVYYRSKFGAQD